MNLSKILSTLIAFTFLALTACGGSSSNDSTENNNTVDNSNSITAPDITGKVYKFVNDENKTAKYRFNANKTVDVAPEKDNQFTQIDIESAYQATSQGNVVTIKMINSNGAPASTNKLTFTTDTSGTFKVTKTENGEEKTITTGTFEESDWSDVVAAPY